MKKRNTIQDIILSYDGKTLKSGFNNLTKKKSLLGKDKVASKGIIGEWSIFDQNGSPDTLVFYDTPKLLNGYFHYPGCYNDPSFEEYLLDHFKLDKKMFIDIDGRKLGDYEINDRTLILNTEDYLPRNLSNELYKRGLMHRIIYKDVLNNIK